jgi:hypothetical protein
MEQGVFDGEKMCVMADERVPTSDDEIRQLQKGIDQTLLRRAAALTMAEKFRMGCDLYDAGMRWLIQVLKAEHPDGNDEQVLQEIDRRREIKRRVEEAGLFVVVDEQPDEEFPEPLRGD